MKFRKPMLAKNYEGNEHTVAFPCYVQPKLDGIRCITDGKTFWSRNGKKFPAKNLKHLMIPQLNALIDGELMVDDSSHFEDIVSAVKNGSTLDRSLADRIQFHAFDIIMDETYHRRRIMTMINVTYAQRRHNVQWVGVKSHLVLSAMQLQRMAKFFLRQGYEGTMIRSRCGRYVSTRTIDLLKWKPLMEKEFEIIDVVEAKGKDRGTPIFVCWVGNNRNGVSFRARPMGTMKQRRKMWRDRKNMPGQMLTVEFQNYTKHGKPRFPRAKVLRDYE